MDKKELRDKFFKEHTYKCENGIPLVCTNPHNLFEWMYEQLTLTDVVKQSELLPDVEKKQLIEDAYWLNLQNLNGREDFEEAFKLGIETGVDETLEKLQS